MPINHKEERIKPSKKPLTPEEQSRLRQVGLLADVHERWDHPTADFHLDPLPIFGSRRQRSDRITEREQNFITTERGTSDHRRQRP